MAGAWNRVSRPVTSIPDQAGLRVPRMWVVFVCCSLVFALVVAVRLVVEFPGPALILFGLISLGMIVLLFLQMTLREALSGDDVMGLELRGSLLRRRLLQISVLILLSHLLIPALPDFQMWWLLAYPMVAAGLTLPLIPAKISIVGLTGLSLGHAWFFQGEFQPILLSLAVLALGAVIIRVMTLTNLELEASRNDVARLAVAEERLRFARDLHDSLGQSLSVIVLKSELGGRLVEQDPGRAVTEIQDAEKVARDALNEVRKVVTGYRQPTLATEIATAIDALEAAGISCDVVNHVGDLSSEIDSALAWGVREGVTNIIRHSGASSCTIRVSADNGSVSLELADNGAGGDLNCGAHRSGNGLDGLEERARALGGTMRAGTRAEGGFRLVLEAPAVTRERRAT